MAPIILSFPARPRLEASTPKVEPRVPYNDNDIILLRRKNEDLTESITGTTFDTFRIPLGLLKKHSTLLRDLFDQRIEARDTESLKEVIYDPCQDPAKAFMPDPGFFVHELIRFVIANKVTGYEFIENLTLWEVFTGVRTWLEWAKFPGFLWNGDNIYVVVKAIPVAEWLGASEEFKAALAAKKALLERGAPVRGLTH